MPARASKPACLSWAWLGPSEGKAAGLARRSIDDPSLLEPTSSRSMNAYLELGTWEPRWVPSSNLQQNTAAAAGSTGHRRETVATRHRWTGSRQMKSAFRVYADCACQERLSAYDVLASAADSRWQSCLRSRPPLRCPREGASFDYHALPVLVQWFTAIHCGRPSVRARWSTPHDPSNSRHSGRTKSQPRRSFGSGRAVFHHTPCPSRRYGSRELPVSRSWVDLPFLVRTGAFKIAGLGWTDSTVCSTFTCLVPDWMINLSTVSGCRTLFTAALTTGSYQFRTSCALHFHSPIFGRCALAPTAPWPTFVGNSPCEATIYTLCTMNRPVLLGSLPCWTLATLPFPGGGVDQDVVTASRCAPWLVDNPLCLMSSHMEFPTQENCSCRAAPNSHMTSARTQREPSAT